MTATLDEIADLRQVNAELQQRLDEALAREVATAEVLQVINSSPGDLMPVFDAMLDKAMRLCEAAFGILWSYDGERFHPMAFRNVPPAYAEFLREPHHPGPFSGLGRVASGEMYAHIADMQADDAYRTGDPVRRAGIELAGARTHLSISLRKDGSLVGNFAVFRTEVRPFSDRQIALLQSFAAQAVIAMENARLITETREALERQTATAEILEVINRSPGDLAPVFDAILEKAHRLCGAVHGTLMTYDGEYAQAVATQGVAEPLAALLRQPFRLLSSSPLAKLVRERSVIHIPDQAAEAQWGPDDPKRIATTQGGVRTMLFVPLRKDDNVIGWIAANRLEVRPFSEKEIALLESFAAQAVIAMENTRLIKETREALEQQTATAEVLGVINSSPGDLAPVFDAMLEKAVRLCEFDFASLWTFDGSAFHPVARHEVPERFWQYLQDHTPPAFARALAGERLVHIAD